MHIKDVTAKNFRRFTDLTIKDLPATARLVVLAGPNGNGKSSLFDVFLKSLDRTTGHGGYEAGYHLKTTGEGDPQITVTFHEGAIPKSTRKPFYFRSAYRNEAHFSRSKIQQMPPALEERRFGRLIDNDAAVGGNYQRIYAQGLEDVFENEADNATIGQFREKVIGEIKRNLQKVMPELTLESLGNPFKVQTFRFSKGTAKKYNYMNLSGGEKAAFDLLLDYVMKRVEFDDTVFCIDEPEAHLNPRVHSKMLDALLDLTQEKSQLWIATHAIGMLRRARDLYFEKPGQIVFLDFEEDFDQPQVLTPLVPDRPFWQRSLAVALDDLAALVAPHQIIACESGKKDGAPGEGYDAEIYNRIFSSEFPETRFLSIGAASDMKGDRYLVVQAVADLIQGTTTLRLIDRDGMNATEIEEHEKKGCRVLRRRQIESYVFDDEVLKLLCASVDADDRIEDVIKAKEVAIQEAVKQGHAADDIKKARGRIAEAVKKILPLKDPGKTSATFMRDTLAPLIGPGTKVYEELKAAIFGT